MMDCCLNEIATAILGHSKLEYEDLCDSNDQKIINYIEKLWARDKTIDNFFLILCNYFLK